MFTKAAFTTFSAPKPIWPLMPRSDAFPETGRKPKTLRERFDQELVTTDPIACVLPGQCVLGFDFRGSLLEKFARFYIEPPGSSENFERVQLPYHQTGNQDPGA
jgi:hypothetical protein